MHKDDLMDLVRYLGYIVLAPEDVSELADEITPYSDLDFDDVVRFVEKYALKECDRFREIFDAYDEDSSGAISTFELRSLMGDLGFSPSKQLIMEVEQRVDLNDNGELSFRELMHFFTVYRHTYGFCKAEIKELRSTFDSFTRSSGGVTGMPTHLVARALIQAFGLQFEQSAVHITKVITRSSEGESDEKDAEQQQELISFEEYLAFARGLKEDEQAEYRKEFLRHDTDGSGHIELEELQGCLRNLGHEPTRGVIVEVLKEVDFEEDGTLDMEEFYNFMLVFRDREGFKKDELAEMRRMGLFNTLWRLASRSVLLLFLAVLLYAAALYAGEPERHPVEVATAALQDASAFAAFLGTGAVDTGAAVCRLLSRSVPAAAMDRCMEEPEWMDARSCLAALSASA